MPTIRNIQPISSIKPGPNSTVLPDGTLTNPLPFSALTLFLNDGTTVQVERPVTVQAIRDAIAAAAPPPADGFLPGQVV